jgi:hypothetical protein
MGNVKRSRTIHANLKKKNKQPIKIHNFYLLKTAQTLIDQTVEEMHQRNFPEEDTEKSKKFNNNAGGNWGLQQ